LSIGDFFSEHRKAIDARKAHLARVGADVKPVRDAISTDPAGSAVSISLAAISMPSQADVLVPPAAVEAPLLEATHKPMLPRQAPAEYETPKLPKIPGVNATAHE